MSHSFAYSANQLLAQEKLLWLTVSHDMTCKMLKSAFKVNMHVLTNKPENDSQIYHVYCSCKLIVSCYYEINSGLNAAALIT